MNKAEKGAFIELLKKVGELEEKTKKQERCLAFMSSRINELMGRVDGFEKRVKDLEREADTGTHEDGLGWNAKGEFCGECTAKTCRGCEYEYAAEP